MSENPSPLALSRREIERERSACREWLAANGGEKMTAESREVAEQSWLKRAEKQKHQPLLTEKEIETLVSSEVPEKVAQKLSYALGYTVTSDDPVLLAALSGVYLHEEILRKETMVLERFIEKMNRYENAVNDAARMAGYNAAMTVELKKVFDEATAKIGKYNENAAKLADKHGQILQVGGGNTALYILAAVGLLIIGLLAVLIAKG